MREGWHKIGGQKLDRHESKSTSWSDLGAATSARAKSARGSHKIEGESTHLRRMLAQPNLERQKMREGWRKMEARALAAVKGPKMVGRGVY